MATILNTRDLILRVAVPRYETGTDLSGEIDTINSTLADIASDSKLTANEKQAIRKEWDIVILERQNNTTNGLAYIPTKYSNCGSQFNTYSTAFGTLATYLNNGTTFNLPALGTIPTPPNWITDANLSVTTNIVGSTFRTNWKTMYDARTALLNKAASEAGLVAAWSGVSGTPSSALSHVMIDMGRDRLFPTAANEADYISSVNTNSGFCYRAWVGWKQIVINSTNTLDKRGFVHGKTYRILMRAAKLGNPANGAFGIYNSSTALTLINYDLLAWGMTTSYNVLNLGTFTPTWDYDHYVTMYIADAATGNGSSTGSNSLLIDWIYFQPVNAEEGATLGATVGSNLRGPANTSITTMGGGNIAANGDLKNSNNNIPTHFFEYTSGYPGYYGTGWEPVAGSYIWSITSGGGGNIPANPYGPEFGFGYSPAGLGGTWKNNINYVVSFYAAASNSVLYNYYAATTWDAWPASVIDLQNPPLSGSWQRYVFLVNFGGNNANTNMYLGFNTGAISPPNVEIYYSNLQIELGDTPSGWTPPSLSGINKLYNSNIYNYVTSGAITYAEGSGYISSDSGASASGTNVSSLTTSTKTIVAFNTAGAPVLIGGYVQLLASSTTAYHHAYITIYGDVTGTGGTIFGIAEEYILPASGNGNAIYKTFPFSSRMDNLSADYHSFRIYSATINFRDINNNNTNQSSCNLATSAKLWAMEVKV
jgi:hypothetical protein